MSNASEIEVLEKEAYANMSVQRFRDAAKTYEHLVSLALREEDYEKALYYAIQAASCWRNDNNTINRLLMFKHIGEIALTTGGKIASEIARKTKDSEQKVKIILLEGEFLEWKYPKKAKERYKEALKILEKLEKGSKNLEEKITISRGIVEVLEKIGTKAELKNKQKELAEQCIKVAQKEKINTPTGIQKALQNYEDALKLYEILKEKEKAMDVRKSIEKLKKKVEELDPFKL